MVEEAGERGLTLILSVGEGGTKVNFCLVRGGGCDLILSRILPISQPPLLTLVWSVIFKYTKLIGC